MTIKVLALASGVTGLADHRNLEGNFAHQSSTTGIRSGVFAGPGGALSTVSAMVARIAPVRIIINNGVSDALGPYLLVSDANVDITFDAGQPAVPRVDRVIARVRDNANDGSGSTAGSIEYLKGQSGGSATALPTNAFLLYEVTVPAGASAGGGGINFNTATADKRVYTTANGGIIPVTGDTEMSAITNPYEGMSVYRKDWDVLYIYDGTTWRPKGTISVDTSTSLAFIEGPFSGQIAVARDTSAIYVYNGSTWIQPKSPAIPVGALHQASAQSLASGTPTAITFGTGSTDFDTHTFHSESTNNTRVTPSVPGYYLVVGHVHMSAAAYSQVVAAIQKNGTRVRPQNVMRPDTVSAASSAQTTAIVACNGSTDYFELTGNQTSSGSQNTSVVSNFESSLSWTYLRPLTY